MKHIYLFFVCILLLGCSSSGKKQTHANGTLATINLSENIAKVASLPLSDAVAQIDIVPLETTDESILGNISKVEVTDNDIWVTHYKEGHIYRFSRSGKFLNIVGKIGEGPEEYVSLSDFLIDPSQKEVYIISSSNGMKVYDFEGNFKRVAVRKSLNFLFNANKIRHILYHQSFFLSQNLCIVKPIDNPKDSLWSIALMDNDFNKKKIFKNPAHRGREEQIVDNRSKPESYAVSNYWVEGTTSIDTYNDELTIKFPDTDTIYQYDVATESFIPAYSIFSKEDKGDYEFTHLWLKSRKAFNYSSISNYYPSKDFIYLMDTKGETIYTYCYNKQDGTVRRAKREGEITEHELPWFSQPYLRFNWPFVLDNDLCGGDFVADFRSIGKYWVDVLEPGTEGNWIDIDKVKASTVKDDAKKQEFIKALENIDEESNPIIMIATLK